MKNRQRTDRNTVRNFRSLQQISDATFTVTGFPYPTGHFCWTPDVNDISTLPHQFTVEVVDNACPNSGHQIYSFRITVNSPLVNINVLDVSCKGLNDGSINVVPVNPGGYSYLWITGGQTTSGIMPTNEASEIKRISRRNSCCIFI